MKMRKVVSAMLVAAMATGMVAYAAVSTVTSTPVFLYIRLFY